MFDETKTEYEIITIGKRKAAKFPDGTIVPMIGGANDGGGSEDEVKFDEKQQAVVDGIVKATYTKAFAKAGETADATAEGKFKPMIIDLEAQLATIKSELETAKSKGTTSNGNESNEKDLKDLRDRVQLMEGKEKESIDRDRHSQIRTMASQLNAVNGEQVAQLVGSSIKSKEDGTLVVLNGAGLERADVSVKDYLAEFLKVNPHLVKASGNNGAGSQGAGPGSAETTNTVKRDAYEAMTPEKQSKFIREGGTLTD